jgi:hypothetical protein
LTPSVKPLGLILKSGLWILHLLECMIFLSLLSSRCKNRPPPMPHDLCMFSHMIRFALCLTMGKAHRWETFLKCEVELSYDLILGPLFWECPHPRPLSYTKNYVINTKCRGTTCGVRPPQNKGSPHEANLRVGPNWNSGRSHPKVLPAIKIRQSWRFQ